MPTSTLHSESPSTPTYTELQARLDALSSRDWQAEIDAAISGMGLDEDVGAKKDEVVSLKVEKGLVQDGDHIE